MGMIDEQYKSTLRVCVEQKAVIFEELVKAKEKVRMLEKLLELNMDDFWDICDQKDWYYEECQRLKRKIVNYSI